MGRDVAPAAGVDRDPRVVEDAILEVALLREEPVDEARHPDGAVVMAQGHDAVGEAGLARVRERGLPAVRASAEPGEAQGQRMEARDARGGTPVVAARAENREDERPVDIGRPRLRNELTREAHPEPGRGRSRVGCGLVEPDRRARKRSF